MRKVRSRVDGRVLDWKKIQVPGSDLLDPLSPRRPGAVVRARWARYHQLGLFEII